jgi:glycosyl transferase family 87
LLAAFVAVAVHPGSDQTIDFRVFYNAAGDYVHRHSPYPPHPEALTWQNGAQHSYVYPPAVAALATPVRLLPYSAAAVVWVLAAVLAVGLALRLLDITDWRCYGAVFLWLPTLTAISIGTLTPLLVLAVAASYRWRDRLWLVAPAVAFAVTAKLFLWPLLAWLWFGGRRIAAAVAAAISVVSTLLCWWWIGFAGFRSYARLLRHLSDVEGPMSYALLGRLSGTVALGVVGGVALLVLARARGDERARLGLAVGISLLATPILWLHYLLLLAVVAPKRLGIAWLLPLILYATPQQGAYGDAWRVTLVGVVVISAAALSFDDRPRAIARLAKMQRP